MCWNSPRAGGGKGVDVDGWRSNSGDVMLGGRRSLGTATLVFVAQHLNLSSALRLRGPKRCIACRQPPGVRTLVLFTRFIGQPTTNVITSTGGPPPPPHAWLERLNLDLDLDLCLEMFPDAICDPSRTCQVLRPRAIFITDATRILFRDCSFGRSPPRSSTETISVRDYSLVAK
jgi:hypothetical protein